MKGKQQGEVFDFVQLFILVEARAKSFT